MDQDPGKPSGRKVRFAPKAPPPSRRPKDTAPTSILESKDEDSEAQAQKLMRQFNEANARQRPKVEKTSKAQVTFGGDASSLSIKSFGARREVNSTKVTDSEIKDSTSDERHIVSSSASTAREDRTAPCSSDASAQKIKEDYKEPWNYDNSYYPTTLPWRKPYSGDPEVLDREEFGEATRNMEYDENAINSASDLGLLDESEKRKLLFFQLPKKLPLEKRLASAKGKEKAESSKASGRADAPKDLDLSKLQGGYVGKMLVFKSGAVKLKLGDTLFDVSPGSDCSFAQELVAMDTKGKNCCSLGELDKRAVITPDIDSILKP